MIVALFFTPDRQTCKHFLKACCNSPYCRATCNPCAINPAINPQNAAPTPNITTPDAVTANVNPGAKRSPFPPNAAPSAAIIGPASANPATVFTSVDGNVANNPTSEGPTNPNARYASAYDGPAHQRCRGSACASGPVQIAAEMAARFDVCAPNGAVTSDASPVTPRIDWLGTS
jgi:hypothetical protein